MSCKKHTKKVVPLEGGRELFSQKKVRRGFFTYRTAITRAARRKPLRLQKLSFLNPPPLEGQELFQLPMQDEIKRNNTK